MSTKQDKTPRPSPATQHRVIPVEWHRVAVEPTDNAPANTDKENHMEGLLMKYFVLKPAGNDRYAAASRRAMRAYADFIREENPVLSDELRDWAGREGAENYAESLEEK